MTKKIIDGVTITADFDCDFKELENYLEYVNLRVNEPFDAIHVTLCDDGCVDVIWARNNQKFERIRRVTGQPD